MRLIDADALIADLEYDVDLDARMLDDMDFVSNERDHVQFDKDCKQNAIDILRHTPTIEPERKGEWTEKEVLNIEDSKQIEQWQSCRCSECGRYDTRPYLYYFDEPRFCSWCGVKMQDRCKVDASLDLISRQDVLDEIVRFSIEEGAGTVCSKLFANIHSMPSAEPDLSEHSVWFRIGETLVDVSKEHISAEDGIKKIREIMVRMKKPSAERKGKWIYQGCCTSSPTHQLYRCDCCGKDFPYRTNCCPNCGASMVRGENDD